MRGEFLWPDWVGFGADQGDCWPGREAAVSSFELTAAPGLKFAPAGYSPSVDLGQRFLGKEDK